MLELKTQDQKNEYELEIARMKARAHAQLYDEEIRKANKMTLQNNFVLSFLLTMAGTCLGFLLGALVK